jgi:2'-phosphotransferase
MGRTHIHFAPGLPGSFSNKASSNPSITTAASTHISNSTEQSEGDQVSATPDNVPVISGMRASASILIWVDVRRSNEVGGIKWWRSSNGVVLTTGNDEDGIVPLDFVDEVVQRSDGKVVWKNERGNESTKESAS